MDSDIDDFDDDGVGDASLLGLDKETYQLCFNSTKKRKTSEGSILNPISLVMSPELASVIFDDIPTIRKKKIVRNRTEAWNFICSWDDTLFYRQFRVPREDFFPICEKLKSIYPGKNANGFLNYQLAQGRGRASTPKSGPITMAIKLAVTLRLLAGASNLDMIWYGVQHGSVTGIFEFILSQLDIVLPDNEIFNFNPSICTAEEFRTTTDKMASEWSAIMTRKRGYDLFKGTILAGDGLVVHTIAPTEELP